jgi:receptor protein-tyrosine kinase
MSRIHDALRRAEQTQAKDEQAPGRPPHAAPGMAPHAAAAAHLEEPLAVERSGALLQPQIVREMLEGVLEVPFDPAAESHLIDIEHPHETPGEEFRTLRTRLNHLQTLQPLHTIVVTSPSPAEGKTFTAVNLALAEAHLKETKVLLGDFDLRRPIIHSLFQTERAPGLSDYLMGEVTFAQALRKLSGIDLYFLPAGTPVKNPLELLNLRQARSLFEQLPGVFDWAVFDSPPLLFSADANLMATLADGTILVVKIGTTTFDSVARAMTSLCENNVLGVVANGARASELYSKYTYYYSKAE